jgi:hypothetical protein
MTDLQWNLGRFQELYDKVEGLVQAAAGGFTDPAAAVEQVRGFLAENDDIAGKLFPNNATEAGTQQLSRSALEKLQGCGHKYTCSTAQGHKYSAEHILSIAVGTEAHRCLTLTSPHMY